MNCEMCKQQRRPHRAREHEMTKDELQKSHDAMARYLVYLCRYSDMKFGGHREPVVEEHYQRARRLIKRAGHRYEPKVHKEPDGGTTDRNSWPRRQQEARDADPRPSEEIVREIRAEWPDHSDKPEGETK